MPWHAASGIPTPFPPPCSFPLAFFTPMSISSPPLNHQLPSLFLQSSPPRQTVLGLPPSSSRFANCMSSTYQCGSQILKLPNSKPHQMLLRLQERQKDGSWAVARDGADGLAGKQTKKTPNSNANTGSTDTPRLPPPTASRNLTHLPLRSAGPPSDPPAASAQCVGGSGGGRWQPVWGSTCERRFRVI
jgi:hypothetical protein